MPKHVLTKAKIIETAITLIESGDPLTFSTLSKQLGSRSQALYNYFANVNELNYAVVAQIVGAAGQQVQDKLFGQSGTEAIVAFAKEFRRLGLDHQALSRFVLTQNRTQSYPDVVAAFTQIRKLLHQLLDGTFQDPTVQTLAGRCIRDLIVGDVINVGAGWFAGGTMTPADSFDQLLRRDLAGFQEMDGKP